MNFPKFTIIIPIFNEKKNIVKLLKSINSKVKKRTIARRILIKIRPLAMMKVIIPISLIALNITTKA